VPLVNVTSFENVVYTHENRDSLLENRSKINKLQGGSYFDNQFCQIGKRNSSNHLYNISLN